MVCWVSGSGRSGQDPAQFAKSTDGGKTWTPEIPPQPIDGPGSWIPNSIDCVTASTCWTVGMSFDSSYTPAVAVTTDGGATWTRFSNLPTVPPHPGTGTYILNGISCVSVLSCVAVGGYPSADGTATVIATTDGGVTWSVSEDPTLAGIEELDSITCHGGASTLPACQAVGTALQAEGPVEMTSRDGGATWSGVETYDHTGWFSSISCPDSSHCWIAGAGTALALVGTADSGSSWSAELADTTNNDGTVSCASASFCVAATDNGVWETSTGGGLAATPATHSPAGQRLVSASQGVARKLPAVSGPNVWARSGTNRTITGQYRGTAAATSASVVIALPSGQKIHKTVSIGLNHYYSVTVQKVARGTTTVTFAAGDAPPKVVRLHGHPGPAPAISALSTHAGPIAGGTAVVITGTNFTGVSKVLFGSTAGTGLKVWSKNRLIVRAPAGTKARYVTVVTSAGGPSALTGRSIYNYLPRPLVDSVSPASGAASGGTSVTITGSGIAFITAVDFGAVPASKIVQVSSREIKATAPAGSGTVDVRVRTPGGTSATGAADKYTYLP